MSLETQIPIRSLVRNPFVEKNCFHS